MDSERKEVLKIEYKTVSVAGLVYLYGAMQKRYEDLAEKYKNENTHVDLERYYRTCAATMETCKRAAASPQAFWSLCERYNIAFRKPGRPKK